MRQRSINNSWGWGANGDGEKTFQPERDIVMQRDEQRDYTGGVLLGASEKGGKCGSGEILAER